MSNDPYQETLRQLLGDFADDEGESAPSSGRRQDIDPENPAASAVSAVSKMLRVADRPGNYIEDLFRHEHYLFTCDGNGAYYIVSLFTMAFAPPGAPVLSAITTAVIRCHDNFRDSLFLPSQETRSGPFFQKFLEDRRNQGGIDYRQAPYRLCSDLILQCLQRMKSNNKLLQGHEARTVARLFGLSTRESFHQMKLTLPSPGPAPNVESLWILLHRPEYWGWSVNEDLYDAMRIEPGTMVVNPALMQQALRCITDDDYRRNRMYAMLKHMAVWHTLGGESQIASWLLWERAAMMNFSDEASAIDAMESNIILQLMINKFFDDGAGSYYVPDFTSMDEYGVGLRNYHLYRTDLSQRGSLPPNVLVTASIADNVVALTETVVDVEEDADIGIRKLSRDLADSDGSCAVCGATTSRNGGNLLKCGRCHAVTYCCREHQVLHWKKGRHKQECAPS